jgi:hypothetical protein
MVSTFFYLTACGLRNRIRVRLRRLREPRYLIGSLAGLAYLYFVVVGRAFRTSRGSGPGTGTGPQTASALLARVGAPMQFIGSVCLLLFAVVAWLWPGSRKPIDFTRSEVQFFFPAPLTRRQLIHYKLLRSQLGLFFGSAVATLFLRPSSFVTAWTLVVGMWVVLVAVRLHSIGISLSRASLAQHGAGHHVRRWAPIVVVAAAIGTLIATAALDWPRLAALQGPGDVVQEMRTIWSSGMSAVVLWPFAALMRLPLSGSAVEFLKALPAALGILAANYVWVLQADASFEEAAADRAEKAATSKRATLKATVKSMPTPFALAPEGRAEMAIMWKNLILVGRYASLRMLIRVLPLVAVLGTLSVTGKGSGLIGLMAVMCLMFTFMTVMIGPQLVRNDLRQDLSRLAILKAWPISGATLLRGELAAPAALLTGTAWLLIATAAVLVPHLSDRKGELSELVLGRLSYGAAAILLAPAVMLVQLVVVNGIAVMFPAWISTGPSRSRGIDAMGQRLLMMAGIWISLVIALLPAALVAGIAGFAIYWTLHVIPVVVPAAIAAVVVLAECWAAVELLGRILDRTDVSAVEPTDG